MLGKWFWEETYAGKLLLAVEAVSLESDDQVLRQIASMSLLTPRFRSEGPFTVQVQVGLNNSLFKSINRHINF